MSLPSSSSFSKNHPPSTGIRATSHDHPLLTQEESNTRHRRASSVSKPPQLVLPTAWAFPFPARNNTEAGSSKPKPARPPRSPLRPSHPSAKRHRRASSAATPSERTRTDSSLSYSGIEYLRGVLRSFSQSLSNDIQESEESDEQGVGLQPFDPIEEARHRRISSLTLPYFRESSSLRTAHISNMSLAEQRSTQRIVDELLGELGPGSPRGSPTFPQAPPKYLDQVRKHTEYGHRRTNSSPGGSLTPEGDLRARTLSGGTFGRLVSGPDSDRATLKGARGGTATAPTSPVLNQVRLPFAAAQRHAEPIASQESLAKLPATTAQPVLPLPPTPSQPRETEDLSASLPQPPPHVRTTESSVPPAGPPPTGLPPQPPVVPINVALAGKLAAVVQMMEKGDSPSKRKNSGTVYNEKGKGREDAGEGRAQTVRRGYIGPGGIMHRITSSQSLSKVRSALPFAKPAAQSTTSIPLTPGFATTPTPTSTTFLRPAPPPPQTSTANHLTFAPSSARNPSPSPAPSKQSFLSPSAEYVPSRLQQPTRGSTRMSGRLSQMGLPEEDVEMIEIPRFKKKELNLGLVRKQAAAQRLVWLGLGALWTTNGLLSLFFDVNVMYMLVQCAIHPSFDASSAKGWQFAAAAYGILWGVSTFVVWLGWELGYEFWRRWRLDRPAIEPIYFSLPASLHLALKSYDHFLFLLHIRTSPLGTPFARDIIPETCYALVQLLPGLLPLLPRAAIAVVLLISFCSPATDVQAPFGGRVDHTAERDEHFFRSDAVGQLTEYAKGVLLAFTVYIAFRLFIVLGSAIGLWMFSGRPLGGLVGHRFRNLLSKTKRHSTMNPPSTPHRRRPKSSFQPRDPNLTQSPQKSWVDHEHAWDWAWKERTRARVQDAFELCIVRVEGSGVGPRNSIFAGSRAGNDGTRRGEMPWGRAMDREMGTQESIRLDDRDAKGPSYSADDFIQQITTDKNASHLTLPQVWEPPRPESSTLERPVRPTTSRAGTTATTSSQDVFYTPTNGNTPVLEKSSSSAEAGAPKTRAPPSAYKPHGLVTEFGVKKEGRESPDSDDDESVGLLSAHTSPRHSLRVRTMSGGSKSLRDRTWSNSSRRSRNISGNSSTNTSNSHSHSASSSSTTRRRAHTTSHPGSADSPRARSSSITMSCESLSNAASVVGEGSQGFMRRARSGTVMSSMDGKVKRYRRMDGEESEDEELAEHGSPVTPRSKHDTTMGMPFGVPPLSK
ncbi:hypothetical protein L202_06130 [Cryptococcus amylolentus CBS 6039]|uniref:Uncharacterized protein n=2 Tax=Cryptococcus amylolentus TaxID=104669 RepID=A0A1E3HIN7_9TREE|nr:hypothetical protein L202_06130 [Cryptococcus amylolentus CBS 6039]ODN76209.1 hypothetical protein L202_06130 [Cryptococcus amylolentus CBS 6039]ODN96309.1 hypothetical protein I350_08331 [Cryptococcus amylolentus CBS 6273]